jgi:prepilin-type processing-associated H-X9-DG protein
MTPNHLSCGFASDGAPPNRPPLQDRTMVGASSTHPGGVNVAFLDGSVEFVRDTVSYASWAALATRAGGEVLSANSY